MKFLIFSTFFVFAVIASPYSDESESESASDSGENSEEVSPAFVPTEDIRFLLFTQANPTTAQIVRFDDMSSVAASHFDPTRPTRFIVHGWLSNHLVPLNLLTTAAYLRASNFNVFVVDWSAGSMNRVYEISRGSVNDVGGVIAQFLDNLHAGHWLPDFSLVTCIGQSLGAHVCGAAGKRVTRGRINTIFGLDPAGPSFNLNDPPNRLAITDADYVEVMHTDIVGLGIAAPIGHADFYPNGGTAQPGCNTGTCDHAIAANYFADSINSDLMWGRRCDDFYAMMANFCPSDGFTMGGDPSNYRFAVRGVFRMPTNANSPFGIGRF